MKKLYRHVIHSFSIVKTVNVAFFETKLTNWNNSKLLESYQENY